jgi:hypothetical protein
MVKNGAYDIENDRLFIAPSARVPDVVIYNSVEDLHSDIANLFSSCGDISVIHLHLGLSDNSPFQSIVVMLDGRQSILWSNSLGNKQIVNLIRFMGDRTRPLKMETLIRRRRDFNNTFSVWNNMFWDVDWVQSMIDKESLHFR